jgi:hypothetical protein
MVMIPLKSYIDKEVMQIMSGEQKHASFSFDKMKKMVRIEEEE